MVINTVAGDRSFVEKYGREPCDWIDGEKDRIVTHLEYAIRTLRERGRETKTLRKYKDAGSFPLNDTYSTSRTPIFIDRFGTPCAVAHLMNESGAQDLANEINKKHHAGYLSDIAKDIELRPKIVRWAQENGYTIEDLALIQPGYTPIALLLFQSLVISNWVMASHVLNQLLAIALNMYFFGEDTRLNLHLIGGVTPLAMLLFVFLIIRCSGFSGEKLGIPAVLFAIGSNIVNVFYVLKDPWCLESGGFWIQELWCLAPLLVASGFALKYMYMSRDPKNYESLLRHKHRFRDKREAQELDNEVAFHTKRIQEGKNLTMFEKLQKSIHPAKHHWVKLKAASKLIDLANRHKQVGLNIDNPTRTWAHVAAGKKAD